MGKYISVGVGTSTKKDAFDAAKEAASEALKECKKSPTFSFVYIDASYDPKKALEGINKILGINWVGITVDKPFNTKAGFMQKGIAVLSILSEHIHFGVGVADNYLKDPRQTAREAAKNAMKSVKVDKYVDAYVQFARVKKSDYSQIVRTPPYFMMTFVSGTKFDNKGNHIPGREVEFLEGIMSYTGPNVPVFGGSASPDFDTYLKESKGKNYQFANGKLYEDSGIVIFVVSNIHFGINISHGFSISDNWATVTKLSADGHEILELNGKEPVAEYARLLGIPKDQYLKESDKWSLYRPFGLMDVTGRTFTREALPNKDKKTLHSTFKLTNNIVLNVLRCDEQKTLHTETEMLKESSKEMPAALAFICSCCGRRLVLDGKESKVIGEAKKALPKLPIFGFYSFAEIGSSSTSSALVHSMTVTSLVLYDKLLSS